MMRVIGSCLLIIGFGVVMIVGLLRVIRDLLSRDVFAGPQSDAEEAGPSRPANTADMGKYGSARN